MPNVIAIAIAIAALVVAAGAWFRPMPQPEAPAAKVYSEQEVSGAKKAVCEAFAKANQSLNSAGLVSSDGQPGSALAAAVNVRLALEAGSRYLSESALQYHFAPADLVVAVDDLAMAYQQIAIAQLAAYPHADIEPHYRAADSAVAAIQKACK